MSDHTDNSDRRGAARANLVQVPAATSAPRREAAEVLRELRAVLIAHGVTLPSLDLDAASLVSAEISPERRPLIELGRANLPTVRALTLALRTGLPDE